MAQLLPTNSTKTPPPAIAQEISLNLSSGCDLSRCWMESPVDGLPSFMEIECFWLLPGTEVLLLGLDFDIKRFLFDFYV